MTNIFRIISMFLAPVIVSCAFFGFVSAQTASDAIAIRIFPNPEHLSALEWYQNQGFVGSPQALAVDGYEGIRDGRTVYVNVANISGDTLYTNIYLISYNQGADQNTVDIFGQILSHWRFNTNISTQGQCNDNDEVVCEIDADCPLEDYCNSLKAKAIRDVKRLSDITLIRKLLDSFEQKTGQYPDLKSGSYLPGKSFSAWTSWSDSLSKALGMSLPIDPVNRFGYCGDDKYNPDTCWDEINKRFSHNPEAEIPTNRLPSGSRVYYYSYNELNGEVKTCAQLETNFSNLNAFRCFIETAGNATYCGDTITQDPNSYGVSEECDTDSVPCVNNDNYAGLRACKNCRLQTCVSTESCGDGVRNGNEECDTAQNGVPCIPTSGGSCTYCETDCALETVTGCQDADADGYGVCPNCGIARGCAHEEEDCIDNPLGADGLDNTVDDGERINPGQLDDCSQYDGVDNNCDGNIDNKLVITGQVDNVDFEQGIIGEHPSGWSIRDSISNYNQGHEVTISLTDEEAESGSQSIKIYQNPNVAFPGTCTKEICEKKNELPLFYGTCTWDEVNKKCSYSLMDTHDTTPPATYNEGETLIYPNQNLRNLGILMYDVSDVNFSSDPDFSYIVRFNYKGDFNFSNKLNAVFGYDISHPTQCNPISTSPWLLPCDGTVGIRNTCSERPTHCCALGFISVPEKRQQDCYPFENIVNYGNTALRIENGNYPDWQTYSKSFTYRDEFNDIYDAFGVHKLYFGIRVGHNATDSDGNTMYIDNLELLQCQNVD